ncbi:PQQ-dependent sugar dehydrogenase [Polynucleobacter sp. MG-6-Vaara-E2]|uniref:PQQ-dependent sugar dehydrogenase n=1 Tax=Polynucleobacter sp. MG-6-Vaara-E2 TaxID=2576932 RepID=UPI001BFE0607|nr:PQQ-dependent sugar dehydrogenase [Polynucleobacter sp. MG-6-Vaara-E2]QWD96895.1 PQQ-dependent sugar dehydrogenase [Polynucleobacter sp. MG-6-Vaara-E2]
MKIFSRKKLFILMPIFIAIIGLAISKSHIPLKVEAYLVRKGYIKSSAPTKIIIDSAYYQFEMMPYKTTFGLKSGDAGLEKDLQSSDKNAPQFSSSATYGGLELLGDKLFFADGDGKVLLIKDDQFVVGPQINLPTSKSEFVKEFGEKGVGEDVHYKSAYFGIKDVLIIPKTNDLSQVFVSSTDYDISNKCYFLSVFENEMSISKSQYIFDNWKKLYSTKPCLSKHQGSKYFVAGSPFLGQSAGGRLATDHQGSVYLTTGDFYFDGVNEKSILQQVDSDYGKLLKISLAKTNPVKPIAQGFRNPQGLTFVGNGFYTTEHGPQGGDELNFMALNHAVYDFGWPSATFGTHYGSDHWPLDPNNDRHFTKKYTLPKYTWIPSIGVSNLIEIKKSSKLDRWNQNLLIASLKDQSLYRGAFDKVNSIYLMERIKIGFRIRDLIQVNDYIYLLEDSQTPVLWKLTLVEK